MPADQTGVPEGLVRTDEGWYVLRDDTHLSRWVEQHHRLSIADRDIERYRHHISVGGTVLDCGANIGDASIAFSDLVGPRGNVLAFEPNPLTFEALLLNLLPRANVSFFNCGIAARRERATLMERPNKGASYLEPGGPARNIPCYPLDDFAGRLSRCDLIHMDIEGAEVEALIGAAGIIERFRPVLVLEVNPETLARRNLTSADLFAQLTARRYEWQNIEQVEGDVQRDILAIPKEKIPA